MAIKPSASAEIRALIDALSSDEPIRREAAMARLAVIGSRAVDRLLAAYAAAPAPATRLAVLGVFEASGEPRALPLAKAALREPGEVAAAAAGVLRRLLAARDASVSTEALDALVATALDRSIGRSVRAAALEGLRDAPADVHQRISAALADDPALAPRDPGAGQRSRLADTVWDEATQGRLPADPTRLLTAAQRHTASAPLGDLQKVIEALRAHEEGLGSDDAPPWLAVRGALHHALAQRASTVALYDLRETMARATDPLPPSFVAALHQIGDASCLEPMAMAYERSGGNDRWRTQLADAFRAIVERERLSRRHALIKRIESRWPVAAQALSTPSRTTPPPTTRGRTSRKSR